MIAEEKITITMRGGPLLAGGGVPALATENHTDTPIELTAALRLRRRGIETKLVLPGNMDDSGPVQNQVRIGLTAGEDSLKRTRL